MSHLPGRPLVVLTGGEPFRQNITRLVMALIEEGFSVQIETNGTLSIPEPLIHLPEAVLTIVVSPKTTKVHFTTLERANAWKYVVKNGDMGANGFPNKALGHSNAGTLATPERSFHNRGRIYMQPCDEGNAAANQRNMDECVNACMTFGHTLQLQVHKIIGVE